MLKNTYIIMNSVLIMLKYNLKFYRYLTFTTVNKTRYQNYIDKIITLRLFIVYRLRFLYVI